MGANLIPVFNPDIHDAMPEGDIRLALTLDSLDELAQRAGLRRLSAFVNDFEGFRRRNRGVRRRLALRAGRHRDHPDRHDSDVEIQMYAALLFLAKRALELHQPLWIIK